MLKKLIRDLKLKMPRSKLYYATLAYEIAQDRSEELEEENGKLKEELKGLQKEYYKLEAIYQPLSCDAEGLLEENHRLKKERTCPDDCAHRANPGPGGSICRNCTRNPKAKDKYTKN